MGRGKRLLRLAGAPYLPADEMLSDSDDAAVAVLVRIDVRWVRGTVIVIDE